MKFSLLNYSKIIFVTVFFLFGKIFFSQTKIKDTTDLLNIPDIKQGKINRLNATGGKTGWWVSRKGTESYKLTYRVKFNSLETNSENFEALYDISKKIEKGADFKFKTGQIKSARNYLDTNDFIQFSFFSNGKIAGLGRNKDDFILGNNLSFYSNGHLAKIEYRGEEGIIRYQAIYYNSGSLKVKANFDSDGLYDGFLMGYYENEIVSKLTQARNGKVEGYHLVFDTLGNLSEKYIYTNDSISDVKIEKENELNSLLLLVDQENQAAKNKMEAMAQMKENIKQNVLLESEKKVKFYMGAGLISVLILLLASGFLLVRNVRSRKIIAMQNKTLEKRHEELYEKNKEVMDSIYYARRIQQALITSEKYINRNLNRLNKG